MRIPARTAMLKLWRQGQAEEPFQPPPRQVVVPDQPPVKPTTTTIGKQKALEYRYYSRLNLLRSDIVGDNAKNQVHVAWQLAYRYAQANKGDPQEAMNVNNAKKVLSDPKLREDYNNALDRYGLEDGRQKDPNWEATLKARQKARAEVNTAPTEVNTAPEEVNAAPTEVISPNVIN